MGDFILLLHTIRSWLQNGLGLALAVALPLALWSWLERSRRISPFSGAARGARKFVDPLIAPIDRILPRFGGSRTSAPWWAVFALLVIGALLLGVLDFLRELLTGAYYASSQGPRGFVRLAIGWSFSLLQLAIAVRVITSWVGGTYSWVGRAATALTEWFLAPLRRALPRIGMVDISPIVAWFALSLLRGIVLGAL